MKIKTIKTIKTTHERIVPKGYPTVVILRERTVHGEREPRNELERAAAKMGLIEFG